MLVGLLCLHCFKRCSFFENLLNLSLLIQKISFQRKLSFDSVLLPKRWGGACTFLLSEKGNHTPWRTPPFS